MNAAANERRVGVLPRRIADRLVKEQRAAKFAAHRADDRRDDGGPAFPINDAQRVHDVAAAAEDACDPGSTATERERAYIVARGRAVSGMTLRDYFAAKAMHALLTEWSGGYEGPDLDAIKTRLGERAYTVADALLKARSA